MKQTYRVIVAIGIAWGVVMAGSAHATLVDLELFNSNPVYDNDQTTPLKGNTSSGDLVELILTPNDQVNTPDATGNPSGGDVLLFSGHIGLGVPFNPDQGYIDVYPITYNASWGGHSNVYVRFFDATTPGGAQWYGNSSVYTLPAGDAFNQAFLDFVPNSSPITYANLPADFMVVPEPSSLFLYGLGFIGVWMLYKKWKSRKTRKA